MKIDMRAAYVPSRPALAPQSPAKGSALEPQDQVVSSQDCPRVFGAVGSMVGALALGRPLAAAAVAVAGGVAGASVMGHLGAATGITMLGSVGAVAGAALGLYGGVKLELKTRLGRVVGGMLGGAVGATAGQAARVCGYQPSPALAQECRGFSLSSLPKKLLDTHYTSHPKLSDEIAREGSAHTQPGDIIITSDDGNFMLELVQRGVGIVERAEEKLGLVDKGNGCIANWTHIYTVDNDHTVIDILMEGGGPTRFPLEHAFTDNTHAKILRPQYSSPQHRESFLSWMGAQFGKAKYDRSFDLKSDNAMYCQEYVYKGMQATDPALGLKPSTIGVGKWKREFVSSDTFDTNPKFPEVWSTGSNFWINWLSHFT